VIISEREFIEILKQLRDALALPDYGSSRDFSRMRRKYRRNVNSRERIPESFKAHTGFAHPKQSSPEGPRLRRCRHEARRAASALSMIRLGEIGQFEIDREGLRELCRIDHADVCDELSCGLKCGASCTRCDGELPQRFDDVEKPFSFLLLQDISEELAEGTNVAAQGLLLDVRGGSQQLVHSLVLTVRMPQRQIGRHASVSQTFRIAKGTRVSSEGLQGTDWNGGTVHK